MSKHALLALAAALSVLAGCTCADTGAADNRYLCTTNDQCADGYFCDRSGECIRNGGAMGGGLGGAGGAGGTGGAGGAGGDGGGAGGGDPDGGAGGGGGGGGSSGGAGGGGGGGGGGTVDAGFLQLVFTSAPQSIPVGTCSAAVNFEVRNGSVPTGVAGGTVVTLNAAPSGVLGLFRGTGCATMGPLTMAPDASTGTFSFFGGDGGAFTLSLTATGIASASQSATATWPAATGLVFLGAPQTLRAGACSAAVQVELRDATSAPAKANASTAVLLSSAPAPGVVFYSDAACTTAITQTTVPVGAARATFYAASNTGQPYTLTALAGTLSATRSHTVLPMVRSGTCTLLDNDAGATCPVSPPVQMLSDSFLVYQVGSSSPVAGAVTVRCDLDAVNNVTCRRQRTDGEAIVAWQVAELTGATVRKVETSCDGGLTVPLAGTANPANSFVLTATENDGFDINDSDFNQARLNAAGTAVDFSFGGACTGTQSTLAQVVTLPTITISRGTTTVAVGSTTRAIADPPAATQGVLFAQSTTNAGGAGLCDRVFRTELQGNSSNFIRANGSAAAACTATATPSLFYERVDFKALATVQQVNVQLAAGLMSTSTTITSVDRTRTLMFTGSHSAMGLGLGETNLLGNTSATDFLGDAVGAFTLGGGAWNSTQLQTTRRSAQGAGRWGVWVVELVP